MMRFIRSIGVSVLLISLLLPANELSYPAFQSRAAGRATVKLESLNLYSEMSTTGAVVKSLKKGDVVVIDLEIIGAGMSWCRVKELGQTSASGFVQCQDLEREQAVEERVWSKSGGVKPSTRKENSPPTTEKVSRLPLRGTGTLYFIPFGDLPSSTLKGLVAHYKSRYGLTISVLSRIKLGQTAWDGNRRQFVAEGLITQMIRSYPKLGTDPNAILIGVAENDMYISTYSWQFAFGFRQAGRFAVVSSARMDPVIYGQPPDDELLQTRLRKMISRYIGFLYFRLSKSNNRRSVLYDPILSIDDLDGIGEDFLR
jgi:predicted Zn-dependent protease